MRDCSRSADTPSVSVGRGGCATVSSCARSLTRSLIADHVVRIRSCASTKIRGIVKGLSFCCSLARVRVLAPSRETFIVARCPSSPAPTSLCTADLQTRCTRSSRSFCDRPFNPCYIGRSSTTELRPRNTCQCFCYCGNFFLWFLFFFWEGSRCWVQLGVWGFRNFLSRLEAGFPDLLIRFGPIIGKS